MVTHLAMAVLAAGAATGVTLGLDRPAVPASASAATALPDSGAVPPVPPPPVPAPAAGRAAGSSRW